MTDTMPEQTEDWSDVEQSADATYPEYPANPHNHRYTISMNGQGPMVVVRGNTAEEINAAWQELEEKATGAIMGSAWASIRAAAQLANGLGASPAPAGPPAMPQAPAGMPVPPPPGVPGTAPAAWQNVGAPPPPAPPAAPQASPEYRQAGWYRLSVPYPQKSQFDAIVAQHQLRKGRPSEGGQLSWNKAEKSWMAAPDIAGYFQQFNPVPA
ncbi:hypothetical protein ACGF5F_29770 [Streptomyces sp. NPDC047821]|uniref:hypothetical protein n=1 Tax=Streptomyces sp. NPDC047821 TaxID=3365488 RepID=UPI00371F7A32